MSISYEIRPAAADLRSPNVGATPEVEKELFETDAGLLTELLGSNAIGDPAGCGVLQNYLTDIKLAVNIQPDLFQASVPYLWGAWQHSLLSRSSNQCFETTSELHSTLFAKPRLHIDFASPDMQARVEAFVRRSLLHAAFVAPASVIGLEWVPYWVSTVSCWPWLAGTIWDDFYGSPAPAHAKALLWWLSCLAYPTTENPLSVDPRAADLWAQASFDSTLHWRPEAIAALDQRLSWPVVEQILKRIESMVTIPSGDDFLAMVASDMRAKHQTTFLRRKSILLANLGTAGANKFWDDEFGAVPPP
jgi:hypothetical protein